nr:MAG TPA: hypothetical protein [Caudoviricetes sp.]
MVERSKRVARNCYSFIFATQQKRPAYLPVFKYSRIATHVCMAT